MRHWSIIVLAIVLIACNQQQEHFVSSFEGKISQVLTVLPIEVGDVGSISSGCVYSGGLTVSPSVCLDATYCEDFIPALLNHVADNVVILYHIGSSERINGKIEDDVFTSNDDKVNEQLKAFSNEFESESNKLVSFDSNFENYDDYLKLIRNEIHVEGYSISSNLDKYRIKKLRKLALKWRELRRRQREDSKNELIKTCKAYEAGKVRIEVRVDYLDELCSESASICHCVKEANELLTSWPQDYLLVQQRSGNSLIRSQFRGERYKQELYNVIAKDVAAKAGIGFAKPSILNIEGGNSLFSSKVVLIGRETLMKNYLDTNLGGVKENLDRLGLDMESVSESMVTEAFESIVKVPVVWVGTEKEEDDYKQLNGGFSSQPLWHIDMFISLLQFRQGPEKDTLVYMLTLPDASLNTVDKCDPGSAKENLDTISARTSRLRKWIVNTADKLDADLKTETNVIGRRIEVPLPLGWDCNDGRIYGYYSFANGLSESTAGSDKFYLPYYCGSRIRKYADTTISVLKSKSGIEAIKIPYGYDHSSALHCTVLVLDRENH